MKPSARGWLPTAIRLGSKTQQAVVRWLEFGSAKLAEPFFDQTVERLLRAEPRANQALTDVETLLGLTRDLSPVTPAGFIFHVSRCGSTLIANALKAAEGAVVVSEAPALSMLLHPDAESLTGGEREAILRSLISLFARYRTGEPARVVIKFPSWNLMRWRVVSSYWPEVPCVVVIRDPVEVIAANLEVPTGWMELKESPEVARRMFGWNDLPRPVEEMRDAEYAARVLRSFYTSASEMEDERTRVVDYQDLDGGEIREIGALFGLELPAGMERLPGTYSKDPSGAQSFEPDGARKQKLATGLVRSAAMQWASGPYRELRKRA